MRLTHFVTSVTEGKRICAGCRKPWPSKCNCGDNAKKTVDAMQRGAKAKMKEAAHPDWQQLEKFAHTIQELITRASTQAQQLKSWCYRSADPDHIQLANDACQRLLKRLSDAEDDLEDIIENL